MKPSEAIKFARAQRKKQTPAEEFFWQRVRGKKIKGFKILRQYPIQHAEIQGRKLHFFPDFYCSEKKLVIEIDGGIHKTQVEYDKERESILKDLGYDVIRFTNEEVLLEWFRVKEKLIDKLENLESRY